MDALVHESRLKLGEDAVELLGDPSDLPGTLLGAIGRRLGSRFPHPSPSSTPAGAYR